MIKLLYEDDRLWLCEKPSGVSSEETPKQDGMPDRLRAVFGAPYVGTVHRLDRVTGGVMAYAKTPETAALLSAAFADPKTPKKLYLAVVEGTPDPLIGQMEDLLFFDRRRQKSFVVDRPRKGTKAATLDYAVLETVETDKGPRSLVAVRLHTGRTHQIRVQFASRKHPVCGDGRYGGRDNRCFAALWCASLSVLDVKGESTPLFEYPWSLFSKSHFSLPLCFPKLP